MNVTIVGCGLIGNKRASAVQLTDRIVGCYDTDHEKSQAFSERYNCACFGSAEEALSGSDSEVIIIAVTNKYIKELVLKCLQYGKHVLVEKPLGRNGIEAEEMYDAYQRENNGPFRPAKTFVKVGFNHRHHPAMENAKRLLTDGYIGRLLTARCRYGHGGRPGLELEWRSSSEICGGGELLDQGVHVIDLIRWFCGEITEVQGRIETKYWNIEVEDNAFAIVSTEQGVTAQFHASWTNWKNIFSFELFGTDGYLKMEGLGGSYGVESLEIGKRNFAGGKPEIEFMDFPTEDMSWKNEWMEFKIAIKENREPDGSIYDGLVANRVIDAIYESSRRRATVSLS
jgi:predicted dehydrogenase